MAKAKKTKKTSAKKAKRFSLLAKIKKINFGSNKVRLATVLIAFALIGGGIMTYRSFAANPTLLLSYDKISQGRRVVSESAGEKRNSKVVEFSPTAPLTINTSNNAQAQRELAWVFGKNSGKTARVCMNVALTPTATSSDAMEVRLHANSISNSATTVLAKATVRKKSDNSYQHVCTSNFPIRRDTTKVSITANFTRIGASKYTAVKVGSVSVIVNR